MNASVLFCWNIPRLGHCFSCRGWYGSLPPNIPTHPTTTRPLLQVQHWSAGWQAVFRAQPTPIPTIQPLYWKYINANYTRACLHCSCTKCPSLQLYNTHHTCFANTHHTCFVHRSRSILILLLSIPAPTAQKTYFRKKDWLVPCPK